MLPSGQHLAIAHQSFYLQPKMMLIEGITYWFVLAPLWHGGGMLLFDQKVGSLLDFYSVQVRTCKTMAHMLND